jgi:creatinine amidohydrolase
MHLGGARAAGAGSPRRDPLARSGAVEQHGPHLPLLVDWLGAEELARRLAPHLARAGWRPVLAPSLPYGASPLAERWPGTVSLSEATLSRLIVEIVRGLASHGFRRFVLTNYQADPAHLRAIAKARRALARRRLRILVAGFSPDPDEQAVMLTPRVLGLMRSPRPEREWHSGEMETAMVLDARPSLVRRAIRATAAAALGGLSRRAGAWRAALRADGPRRTGLFRLARGGAGGHRAPGDGAAGAAHGGADHGGARTWQALRIAWRW